MNYRELQTRQGAALNYVTAKIAEFGNESEVAVYKAKFQEIESYLVQMPSRIAVIGELERQIQVQATIVDMLSENIDLTDCEHRIIDMKYNYQSAALNELIEKMRVA